jgi:diaminohydroxyphosphoribosylaminopyrimidine deaminase/5-amino-6-(5-phosphoribosylamino)uracil reductase
LHYLAPQLLGPGQGMAHLPPLEDLSGAVALAFHAVDRVGADVRLLLRRQRAAS